MELRIDHNTGLIDLKWCEQVQRNGLVNLGRPTFAVDSDERFDASDRQDDAVPLARDLNYVIATTRDTYRPLRWASVLQVVTVPDWAERWEISKITGTGSITLASKLQNSDFLQADFSRSTTTGRMYEFANGYSYANREMVAAARLGINPSIERAKLQMQAADELLETLAVSGNSSVGMKGLATLTPSTDLPALVTPTTKTSGTAWASVANSVDYTKILVDLHRLTDAVYQNSKERRYADTLVMALDEFQAINSIRASNFSANVLTTFQEEWNRKIGRAGRIIVWDRLALAAASGTAPRVIALDGSDTDVACMVMGKAYSVDQVLEVPRGFQAIASMVTGGFRSLDTNGIAYMDLDG